MRSYLIEFRFSGYAKKYLKKTIFDVGRKFRVKGMTKKHVVPHITLFGPFRTSDEKKVISAFHSISKRYSLIPFQLKGFGNFRNDVIYVEIIPSEELKKFRRELAKGLTKLHNFFIFKIVKTKGVSDYEKEFQFHATIAFRDIQNKFNRIINYLKNKKNPHIKQRLLRITLLKNSRILYEYDFLQKKLLNKTRALDKNIWRKTISLLKKQ